jgi:hypothetical protein
VVFLCLNLIEEEAHRFRKWYAKKLYIVKIDFPLGRMRIKLRALKREKVVSKDSLKRFCHIEPSQNVLKT